MSPATSLHYEAPWPIYALDWCKTVLPGRPRSVLRLGVASFTDDYRNRVAVVGPPDARVLVEDDHGSNADGAPPLVTLAEANLGFPATRIQWQPPSASGYAWARGTRDAELLATTGDVLRIWEYMADGDAVGGAKSGYVGQADGSGSHRLSVRSALTASNKGAGATAPLTSCCWNALDPTKIVTASIDTTCTVWDINKASATTQLIAHDREVYDVAWLPGSTDIFVSVGADGSLRAFDLRSLDHSTILYETPAPKKGGAPAPVAPSTSPGNSTKALTSPLLRICFHPTDSNYMATFFENGQDVQILDMRSPGQPVLELRAHKAQVTAAAFSGGAEPLLATAGDDCQLLLWDIAPYTTGTGSSASSSASRMSSPRPDPAKKRVADTPVMAYTGEAEITSMAFSPALPATTLVGGQTTAPGEWLAMAMGRTVKALKV